LPRVKLIQNKEDIAPEHYPLFDELAALRGRISGPSTVVLHSPGLARPWNEVSEYLHSVSVVEAKDAELAVCVAARESDCPYIWASHVVAARNAGVSEASLTAVRDDASLTALPSSESQVALFARELMRTNRVDAELFNALLAAHDERWLVELCGWIGRYAALAGILNAFEVPPASATAEPLPSERHLDSATASSRPYGDAPRISLITSRDQVAADGQALFDEVVAARGSVRGPAAALLWSPPLGKRVHDINEYFRTSTVLDARAREGAALAVAREKDCPHLQQSHAVPAREAGLDGAAIDLIAAGGDIAALPAADRDVVDYVQQVLRRPHRVTDELFGRLQASRGIPWLVELTALTGHYGFGAAVLNACEVGVTESLNAPSAS
jgi:4-carboxymuconolactone decarboxylase